MTVKVGFRNHKIANVDSWTRDQVIMNHCSHREIEPLARPAHAVIRPPGSKSITNRAFVIAALSEGSCELCGVLRSEDTEVMVECLQRLGFQLDADWAAERIVVHPSRDPDRIIPAQEADLFVGNSGTTMRFLTALVALGQGRYQLDGLPRMRQRPMQDLLEALGQLGVRTYSQRGSGFPPLVVEAAGLNGGCVRLRGDISSQFLSGLLMAAPRARSQITIEMEGEQLVSVPYVFMTLEMMRTFGVGVMTDGMRQFLVPAPQRYWARRYDIEPDASAASYFFAAAAITGGSVTVPGLTASSVQGDVAFVDLLEAMGCQVVHHERGITVSGRALRGLSVDMNAISDTVMTLAAVACFADGPTTIRNVAHIRHKETDRLAALATELRRVGAGVTEHADGLTIQPAPLHGATIETYNDHRMAMSMSLLGLRIPGIIINNPACVGKTYPEFFADLEKLA
jgi:3-phosphoshikimate 1-carboxyvinyltransferase